MAKKQFNLGSASVETIERFRELNQEYSYGCSERVTNEDFISFLLDQAEGIIMTMSDEKREARRLSVKAFKDSHEGDYNGGSVI